MDENNIKTITQNIIEDFIKLYEVFKEASYFEALAKSMIIEEYEDLYKSGHIYDYYLNKECVCLITFRQMRIFF